MATDLKGKKVLIVEDDSLLHNLLAGKLAELRERGVEIQPTFDGEQALKLAKDSKPDLIVLDLMLPGMSGFEFLEKLRAEPGITNTKVIVFSNLSQTEDKERVKSLGVVDFLVKADTSLDDISAKIVATLEA